MTKIINILILLALIALIVLKLKENKQITENRVYQYDKNTPVKVFSEVVKTAEIKDYVTYTGTFEPDKEVKVNADIQGKITKYYVKEGDRVRQGQPLVKLDDKLLRNQLSQINIQIETLEKDLQRYQILADADAVPGIKLEKVQQGIKTAQAQKQSVLTKISKTTVRAPFNGTVTMKFQEAGAFAAPGVPLVLLSDLNHVKFKFMVPEKDLIRFSTGMPATVIPDRFPQMSMNGKITRVGNMGTPGNTFPVEISLKNPKNKIKSKMFGKYISKTDDKNNNRLIIPAKAVIGSEKDPQVYVIKNGKAIRTSIEVGARYPDKLSVNYGLKAGDTIVTAGFINLFDGAHVITE
jgi:RND family efflux transporter MFP subunit